MTDPVTIAPSAEFLDDKICASCAIGAVRQQEACVLQVAAFLARARAPRGAGARARTLSLHSSRPPQRRTQRTRTHTNAGYAVKRTDTSHTLAPVTPHAPSADVRARVHADRSEHPRSVRARPSAAAPSAPGSRTRLPAPTGPRHAVTHARSRGVARPRRALTLRRQRAAARRLPRLAGAQLRTRRCRRSVRARRAAAAVCDGGGGARAHYFSSFGRL